MAMSARAVGAGALSVAADQVAVPQGFRVEIVDGTILGTGEYGEPTYVGHRATVVDELLAGDPPALYDGPTRP